MKPRNLLSSSLANLAKYIYPVIGTSFIAAKKQNTESILANTYASVVTPLNVLCEQLQRCKTCLCCGFFIIFLLELVAVVAGGIVLLGS